MDRIVRVLLLLFAITFSSLAIPRSIYALNISISDLPANLDQSSETEVGLYFECSGCGDSYMRGVFYAGGTDYFGFTQNNSGEWIGTWEDRSQYFKIAKIDLIEASWSGRIKVRPDSGDSAYHGPGEYLFKIGRYTSSGDSSADWSNVLALRIIGPTPTPTTTPTATPTQTPSPIPTVILTSTPTGTKPATPVISGKPKTYQSSQSAELSSASAESVLGVENSINTPKLPDGKENRASKKQPLLGYIFMGLGAVLVLISIILAVKPAIFTDSK